jgi:protein-disulfide isomerase
MEAWERAMADPALRKQVETDQTDAGSVPLGSVPTFFVNGQKFRGKLELGALQAVVDK